MIEFRLNIISITLAIANILLAIALIIHFRRYKNGDNGKQRD
jgi:hypothetical protein